MLSRSTTGVGVTSTGATDLPGVPHTRRSRGLVVCLAGALAVVLTTSGCIGQA